MGIARRELLIGIIIAAAASVLINAPLLSAVLFNGELQHPDVVFESSDETYYLSHIKEVADGYAEMGNPYTFERRETIYTAGQLGEVILGTVMRITGASLKTIAFAADIILPLLLVLLSWFAVRRVVPAYSWRILLVGALFLGAQIVFWKRPISPQFNALPFIAYLGLLLHSGRNEPRIAAMRGATIGVLLFTYPFFWTFCISIEACHVLYRLIREPRTPIMKSAGVFALAFAIFFVLFALLQLSSMRDPATAETAVRLGLIDTRWPSGPLLQLQILGTALVMIAAWYRTRSTTWLPVFLPFLGAGLIVLNQSIITGKEIEFSSHYAPAIRFTLWIILAGSLWSVLPKTRPLRLTLWIILFAVITACTATHAVWNFPAPPSEERDELADVIRVLSELPPEQVILTEDQSIAGIIPLYTSHYPFFAHETHLHIIQDDDLVLRAQVQQQLFPEVHIPDRAIFGTQQLNQALRERMACVILQKIPFLNHECTYSVALRASAMRNAFDRTSPISKQEMRSILHNQHVTHILARDLPPLLEPATVVSTMSGGWRIYALAQEN